MMDDSDKIEKIEKVGKVGKVGKDCPIVDNLCSNLIVAIEDKPLNITNLISQMKDPKGGAVSIFLGTTRDFFGDKKVLTLFYEAHPTMALKKMEEIAEYVLQKWKLIKIAIVHRIGEVPVTEESIAILATSSHRKEAMEATQFCIDEVKRLVPIWKKEIYTDGEATWKENCECIHLNSTN